MVLPIPSFKELIRPWLPEDIGTATGISARVHLLFNCYPQVTSLVPDCQEVSSGYRKEGLACFFILVKIKEILYPKYIITL